MTELIEDFHDVSSIDLGDRDLRGVNLKRARGLTARQLRGADLTNAHLPEELKKFEELKVLENASKAAGRIWATAMLACLYCWLTIGGTTDAQFFGAEHETALPFIQMKMPMTGFYAVAPLILLVVFLYLQFSLQTVWEIYATLPAVFPDGRRLHERSAPFFLSGIVRAQYPRLGANGGLAKGQVWLAWLLGWWVIPFTLCWLWKRSLVARLWWITAPQIVSIGVAIVAALSFMRIARYTLRGTPETSWPGIRLWIGKSKSRWEALAGMGALGVFALLSLAGYSSSKVSANLEFATLSTPKSVIGTNYFGIDFQGRGVDLKNRDLRNAHPYNAELWGADLSDSNLREVRFIGTDLRTANFTGARLFGTQFDASDLRGSLFSNISKEKKCGAHFYGANLQGAQFGDLGSCVDDIRKDSETWILAFYGNPCQLHLPKEHTTRLIRHDLTGYKFTEVCSLHMRHADLHGWNLQNTNFSSVVLDDADLAKSDMRGAILYQSLVVNTNFEGADLRGADLSYALGLTQAQVNTMITDKSTKLPDGLHPAAPRS